MYFIAGGEGKLTTPTSTLTLKKGHLYLVPSFTLCNYSCSGTLHQFYLQFSEESPDGTSLFFWNRKIFQTPASAHDIELWKRILVLNPGRGLTKSIDPKIYQRRPIMQGFQEQNELLSPSALLETHGIILQLLSRFMTGDQFQFEQRGVIPSKITTAVNYIQTNLQQEITVAELAALANLNADYFSRQFTEHMGERPLRYVQSKRIERAQFLILTTDLSFYEIAVETGFETLAYFSRMFKRITSQSPSEYRRNNRI
jgi:AraC-like DNA-binding protein